MLEANRLGVRFGKMSRKRLSRARNVTISEAESRLQNAGDHLGAMMKYEKEASDAAAEAVRRKDFQGSKEAARRFAREFGAFVAAARTAWNFLIQLAKAAGSAEWLNGRLENDLCRFHRKLADQDTHSRDVIFGVRQRVNVEGSLPMPLIHVPPGVVRKGTLELTVTEFVDMAYQYNPKNLDPEAAVLCERVLRQYSNRTVVELAGLYLHELQQTLKSAQRKGRFEPKSDAEKRIPLRPGE